MRRAAGGELSTIGRFCQLRRTLHGRFSWRETGAIGGDVRTSHQCGAAQKKTPLPPPTGDARVVFVDADWTADRNHAGKPRCDFRPEVGAMRVAAAGRLMVRKSRNPELLVRSDLNRFRSERSQHLGTTSLTSRQLTRSTASLELSCPKAWAGASRSESRSPTSL